jgi:hypothetical protein
LLVNLEVRIAKYIVSNLTVVKAQVIENSDTILDDSFEIHLTRVLNKVVNTGQKICTKVFQRVNSAINGSQIYDN